MAGTATTHHHPKPGEGGAQAHSQHGTLSRQWRGTTRKPNRQPRPPARIGDEPPNTNTSHLIREQHKTPHPPGPTLGLARAHAQKRTPPTQAHYQGPRQEQQGITELKRTSARPKPGATEHPAPTPTPTGGTGKQQTGPPDNSQAQPPDRHLGGNKDRPPHKTASGPHTTPQRTHHDRQLEKTGHAVEHHPTPLHPTPAGTSNPHQTRPTTTPPASTTNTRGQTPKNVPGTPTTHGTPTPPHTNHTTTPH